MSEKTMTTEEILQRMDLMEEPEHEMIIYSSKEHENKGWTIGRDYDDPFCVTFNLFDIKGDSIPQIEEKFDTIEECVKYILKEQPDFVDNFLFKERFTEDFKRGYLHALEIAKSVLIQHKLFLKNDEKDDWAKSALHNAQRDIESKIYNAPKPKD